jgi:hypothetical protein
MLPVSSAAGGGESPLSDFGMKRSRSSRPHPFNTLYKYAGAQFSSSGHFIVLTVSEVAMAFLWAARDVFTDTLTPLRVKEEWTFMAASCPKTATIKKWESLFRKLISIITKP